MISPVAIDEARLGHSDTGIVGAKFERLPFPKKNPHPTKTAITPTLNEVSPTCTGPPTFTLR